MHNLTHLLSLSEAIETGSLSAAARKLGLTQPAISQHLRQLEQMVGQPLLVRARQGVRPTRAGEIMQTHARRVLADLAQMDEQLDALNGTISGTLKFTASAIVSQTVAVDFFSEMRRRAPDLKVELIPTDELLDVEEQQINLALRAGQTGKGGGVIRRVAELAGLLVASPAYLDRVGRPTDVSQLRELDYVQYREDPDQVELPLVGTDGRELMAPLRPAFAAHSPSLMLHAIESGLGFSQCPLFFVHEWIKEGRLEHVLPDYMCRPKPLYFVQSTQHATTLRNQLARDVLLDVMANTFGLTLSQTVLNARQAPNVA